MHNHHSWSKKNDEGIFTQVVCITQYLTIYSCNGSTKKLQTYEILEVMIMYQPGIGQYQSIS